MILHELTLHNFGPFRGECKIDLSPTGSKKKGPIVLVGALNGSGKTSLLDAVLLALYGSRARCSTRGNESYSEFLGRCTNRFVRPEEGGSVRLSFQSYRAGVGEVEFELLRRWHAAGSRTLEQLTVYRDGVADGVLSETWSEHVESLIPLGISNLFFFDGEQVRELASGTETTEEVQEAIRTLLGLELPKRLQRDLEIVVRRRRKHLVQPEDLAQVEERERELETLKREVVAATNDYGEVVRKREHVELLVKKARSEFVAKGGALAAERVTIEAEVQQLQRQAADIRGQLRELAAGPLPLGLALDLFLRTREQAEHEVKAATGEELVSVLTERDAELLEYLGEQRTSAKTLRAAREFLEHDRGQRVDHSAETHLKTTRDMLHLFIDLETRQLPHASKDARRLREVLGTVDARVEHLTRKLSGAAPQETAVEQLSLLEDLETRLKKLLKREGELKGKLDELQNKEREENEQLGKMLKRLNEQQREFDEGRRIIEAGERVQEVAERYKMALLSRKLQELERLIAARFRHLSRKDDFVHHISVHPETFGLTLYDREGSEIDKRRMSAGEQQLLAVAFLWALSEASGRLLPLVIDTPLSRMDSKHRDHLVRGYFPHASHQVVLLSTDVEIDQSYYLKLCSLRAIDRTYHIEYSEKERSSTIHNGYFWRKN